MSYPAKIILICCVASLWIGCNMALASDEVFVSDKLGVELKYPDRKKSESYTKSVFSDHGYVIVRIGDTKVEYVLLGQNTNFSLGEYGETSAVEYKELSENSSIVYLTYKSFCGTGVCYLWKLVMILEKGSPVLFVNFPADSHIFGWGVTEGSRGRHSKLEAVELIEDQTKLRLRYTLMEDGGEDNPDELAEFKKVSSVCTLTEEKDNSCYNLEMMVFLGLVESKSKK